jgi:hypothetical protein
MTTKPSDDPKPEHPDRIRDAAHPEPHPKPDHPDRIRDGVPHPEHPIEGVPPPRGPRPTPLEGRPVTREGETTRVLLTGDDRTVVTEAYIPTADYGFRIIVNGQPFEQVGEAADSGTRIFAPTR